MRKGETPSTSTTSPSRCSNAARAASMRLASSAPRSSTKTQSTRASAPVVSRAAGVSCAPPCSPTGVMAHGAERFRQRQQAARAQAVVHQVGARIVGTVQQCGDVQREPHAFGLLHTGRGHGIAIGVRGAGRLSEGPTQRSACAFTAATSRHHRTRFESLCRGLEARGSGQKGRREGGCAWAFWARPKPCARFRDKGHRCNRTLVRG